MRKLLKSAERALLLSIKPKYVEQLLSGVKVVELRRTRPSVKRGDLVLIYESSPTMALVGYGIVEAILCSSPKRLWSSVKDKAGLGRKEFDTYFQGATIAFAIELKGVRSLNKPVWLSKLRVVWRGFHPPQVYRYLTKEEMGLVLEN